MQTFPDSVNLQVEEVSGLGRSNECPLNEYLSKGMIIYYVWGDGVFGEGPTKVFGAEGMEKGQGGH